MLLSRMLAMAVAAVILMSCASSVGVTSPYYHPAGTDLFYRYGNFCGPGVPVAEGQPTAENIAAAVALVPVDYIDMTCKVHDLCYLRFGVQPLCDHALQRMHRITQYSNGGCDHLSLEISTAVLIRATTHDGVSERMAGMAVAPLTAMNALFLLPNAVMRPSWPKEGTCRLVGDIPDVAQAMTLARLEHEFGGIHFHSGEARSYSASFSLSRFLAGSW